MRPVRDIENEVHIEPWGQGDLPLLEKLLGDPAMTQHIGGPETLEKLAERQARYERTPEPGRGGSSRSFTPPRVKESDGSAIGSAPGETSRSTRSDGPC